MQREGMDRKVEKPSGAEKMYGGPSDPLERCIGLDESHESEADIPTQLQDKRPRMMNVRTHNQDIPAFINIHDHV